MPDHQNIVDRVRALVAGADQTRSDSMAEVATDYASACVEANSRLRRCVDFLHRGLRSEAIHLAECHPNLLEMVAALDIPEIDEWEQICAMYELARPSRMMIELAQELNEAYADEQPLQHLLSQHRLLALTRAPIRNRLEVLRKLAAADPGNPCWSEDQAAFENVRVAELRPEVSDAIKSRNLKHIDQLADELLHQAWRIELPPDVKDTLSRASWGLHATEATTLLQEMVPQIHAAIAADSCSRGRELLHRWREIAEKYKVKEAPELHEEFRTLRKWVTDRETFDAACADLKLALDTRAPEEVLKVKYRSAMDTGIQLPASLGNEYRQRMGKKELGRRFERIVAVAIVSVLLIGAVALIVMMAWKTGNTK